MAKLSPTEELGCEGSLLSAPGLFLLFFFSHFSSVPFHLLYAPDSAPYNLLSSLF